MFVKRAGGHVSTCICSLLRVGIKYGVSVCPSRTRGWSSGSCRQGGRRLLQFSKFSNPQYARYTVLDCVVGDGDRTAII